MSGQGDITNPGSWQDANGNSPPLQFQNVPQNVNYPLNGDGRYWFQSNAYTAATDNPITFIGDTNYYVDSIALQWSVIQIAGDGSTIAIKYSTNGGSSFTTVNVPPSTQYGSLQNGAIVIPLAGCTGLQVEVISTGGTPSSTAPLNQVAIAITRNVNETLSWDSPNPFDPINYNAACMDNVVPTDTLANLRARMLSRLGFGSVANNPPPGMTTLINDFLQSSQKYLYRRYSQLHTTRLFRWKVNPGQRFYSIMDNDEDVICGFTMDPLKKIVWAGIQDTRNVWYPLIQGIPPQLYTMIDKPWRPARYDIRQAIELYPMPDQTYWLWMKAHFGLMTFTADSASTTIDSELVFMWALAKAKAHYGQPDAIQIQKDADDYRRELVAGTHQTAAYIPGTIAVPPAVRPTLIQYQSSNGS